MSTQPDGELFSIVSIVHPHQHLLKGCYCCKLLCINPNREVHFSTEKDFWIFSKALFSLNQRRLSASELALHDINFTSTICPTCAQISAGEKFRQRQRAEGNFPCFGSACNGYCDQSNCKYRLNCITRADWDPSQESYYTHVFLQIAPRIPSALNAQQQ